MELFNRRYFCFICFAFMITTFILTFYGAVVKIVVGAVAAFLLVIASAFFVKAKKYKFNA